MTQEIKITLIQSLIINSVKNETYHRGQVTKGADPKAADAVFHDQAGNEQHHEAMLGRYMFTQAERLKTWFAEYLDGNGFLADDPLISSDEKTGTIEICLKVSDRFNRGYVKTIARLGQKYVEDRMCHLWWASTNEKLSVFYAQLAEDDLAGLRRCFSKVPPAAPSYIFPTAITLRYPILQGREGVPGVITPDNSTVDPRSLYNNPLYMSIGEDTEISYVLTGEDGKAPIDDIVVRCDNECVAPYIHRGDWKMRGLREGVTIVTLFSRHDDQVFARFAVRVTS